MTTTLTRRRTRERERHQPTLFSQVVAPPREDTWRDERRDDAGREELRPEPLHLEAPAATEPAHVEAPSRTLDEAISALWGELTTTGTAIECPVCGDEMDPRHSAGAGVVGARCTSCATTLA